MQLILKNILRFAMGLAILGVGIVIMNGLISLKPELPVSDRPVPPRSVRVLKVSPSDWIPETPVEGRVDAVYRMDILTEVTGVLQIGGKEFREGMRYDTGEVMLRLDDREARLALVGQRSQFLQLMSTSLADLRADFPDRWGLWDEFIGSIELDEDLPDLPKTGTSREQLFLANRGILSSFHAIRSTEDRLDKYVLSAPFPGVVSSVDVRPGMLVRAGQRIGVLIGDDSYEVKTAVHARYLQTIRRGDAVTFYDEKGGTLATGSVARLAANVDPDSQSASVYCRIRGVNGNQAALRDGRYVSGVISSAPIAESVRIPNAWIQNDGLVFTVVSDSLRSAHVDVIFHSPTQSIVFGLTDGTLLLAEVLSTAFDGMVVASEPLNDHP